MFIVFCTVESTDVVIPAICLFLFFWFYFFLEGKGLEDGKEIRKANNVSQ